jgi:hypothetical protein
MKAAGLLEAAVPALEVALEHVERVDVAAQEAVERHDRRVVQVDVGAGAGAQVAAHRERAERHPVEAVREGDHPGAAGRLARQLERRLDGVRAARPGELQLVLEAAGLEDDLLERLEEVALRGRRHVQAVGDAVLDDVAQEDLLEARVVVPVVQDARAGQEVDVLAAVLGDEPAVDGLREDAGEAAAVAADLRLEPLECLHDVSFPRVRHAHLGCGPRDRRAGLGRRVGPAAGRRERRLSGP